MSVVDFKVTYLEMLAATGVRVVCHRSFSSVLVLTVLLAFGYVEPAHAAKAIEARIEQNGKLILQGIYTGDDYADAAEIWAGLDGPWLKAVQDISSDPSEPQQATLTGDIRIVVSWRGKPIATAQTDKLRLVQVPGKADQWRIPRDEVERTAATAGLQLRPPVRPQWSWFIGAIGVCLLLGALGWLVVRYLRRQQSDFPAEDLRSREPS